MQLKVLHKKHEINLMRSEKHRYLVVVVVVVVVAVVEAVGVNFISNSQYKNVILTNQNTILFVVVRGHQKSPRVYRVGGPQTLQFNRVLCEDVLYACLS